MKLPRVRLPRSPRVLIVVAGAVVVTTIVAIAVPNGMNLVQRGKMRRTLGDMRTAGR